MSTRVFVDPESSTQPDGAQSSRVPAPFHKDPCEAIRQACLVETDTESEPSKDLIDTDTPESPHVVAPPTPLPDSTPPAYHIKESEDSDTSGARSMSSDSTTPLSRDHPLTRTSPTPTPSHASFHRMTVRAQPVMSLGHSARVAEALALSDSALRKRYRSSYETSSSSLSLTLPVRKRYRGTSELILDTDSEEDEIGEEDTDEDEGHGVGDEGHGLDDEGRSVKSDGLGLEREEEAAPEGQQREVPVVRATASAPLGLGYGALRHRELAVEEDQPTLTTWIDPEDGIAYIDILAYPPPAPPTQTPPSPEWSSGSLPVSPAPSAVPLPISSPMISLTIPSPIASPMATPTATILVDEDQFIEIEVQLELFRGILQDHTQRLDVMPPTLFEGIDRDVRELYTRSGVVKDEIVLQKYRFRSLELKQERTVVTFGALWRPVLALEAWAGHVDTRMANISREGYDDHRMVHDIVLDAMSRSGSYSNAQLEPWESEETPLEGTNLLEGQCIELGNGTSLLMIMVEKFELNFRGEIPLRGMVMKSFGAFREVSMRLAEIVTQHVPARQ
ncbi:hypothetical protein Tco_1269949 [Tanacetum coccineum]